MSLEARLKRRIAEDGPLSVADYMTACLHDPTDGYYATRPRIGAEGDFVTAPLVSQMFGELIGLWAVAYWRGLGAPDRFRLVEVGPGDATLIEDALRAAALDPEFLEAAELVLVEPSRPLREVQSRRLAASPLEPRWIGSLDGLDDDLPIVLIANEVLDCLPAHQFVRTEQGWAERRVGLDAKGALTFGLVPVADHPSPLWGGTGAQGAPGWGAGLLSSADLDRLLPTLAGSAGLSLPASGKGGQVIEVSPAQAAFGRRLGDLLAAASGAALLIDYGRARPEPGDTLQALRRHEKVDPLAEPGHADLTVWADFPTVLASALNGGADVTGVITQGEFLRALGVEARTEALVAANPAREGILRRQLARLVDPDEMGELFKAAAIFSPRNLVPAGFERTA